MAPTETLAEQHFATLERCSPACRTPIGLLTGSTPAARRRRPRSIALATGELPLIVGTHALIEPTVRFARLARRRRRRAAPLRRRPAPRARRARVEQCPARAAHDRDADPADAVADRLRRPRRRPTLRELPGGPAADQDLARRRGAPRRRLRASSASGCARAGRPTSSARSSANRRRTRRRPRPPRPSGWRPGSSATSPVAVLHGQMPSAEKARAMARFADGSGRRAGRDERDRGGDRRRQRLGDADRGRRPLRAQPAPPAARAGRSRRARVAVHPLRRPGERARAGPGSRR